MDIARLLYSAIGQHRVVSIAAGVTFFVLLAIFPAIAALVSIYGIFSDPATIRTHLDDLSSFLPAEPSRSLAIMALEYAGLQTISGSIVMLAGWAALFAPWL